MKHLSTIHRSHAFNLKSFLDEKGATRIFAMNDFFINQKRWETYQFWIGERHYTMSLCCEYPYTVVSIEMEGEVISEYTVYRFIRSGILKAEEFEEGIQFLYKLEYSSYKKKAYTYYPPFNRRLKNTNI